jgi:copper chaperone
MRTVRVSGMSCQHCVKTVIKTLEEIDGITNVTVDLETGEVTFEETSPVDNELMREKIKKAGYELG